MSTNNNVQRRTSSQRRSSIVPWERDEHYALNQSPDNTCSAEILLRWLTTPHNFDKYRGETTPGVPKKTKAAVLNEIVDFFVDNGIPYRKAKNIRSRIDRMMNAYREAVDWETRYNNGTLEPAFYALLERKTEEQKEQEIKAQMSKICKEYDRIHPHLRNATWALPHVPSKRKEKKSSAAKDDDEPETDYDSAEEISVSPSIFPTNHSLDTTLGETSYDGLSAPLTEEEVSLVVPPPSKKIKIAEDDSALRKELELQQLTQLVAETEIKRAELKLKEEKASLEKENMLTDIMIKKNKAALESLKFMHGEGLITKEEYKERCTKILELYNELQ